VNVSNHRAMGLFGYCALLLVLIGSVARADQAAKLKACELAIDACKAYTYEQGASITKLKAQVSILEDRLADAQSSPIVPTWLVIVGSVAGGIAIGYTLGHH
jgi:hypothetical protein